MVLWTELSISLTVTREGPRPVDPHLDVMSPMSYFESCTVKPAKLNNLNVSKGLKLK